jgi:hypothetical protein
MRGLLIALLLVGPVLVLMEGCHPGEKPVCAFQEGDIVQTVVGNQVGQVVYVGHRCSRYEVRFYGHQIFTDTHLIDEDGPLHTNPFFTEYLKEYEIGAKR